MIYRCLGILSGGNENTASVGEKYVLYYAPFVIYIHNSLMIQACFHLVGTI